MKKIILILVLSLVMALSGCCIYDYGCATAEMVDMIAEGTAETYVETQTGETFNPSDIAFQESVIPK